MFRSVCPRNRSQELVLGLPNLSIRIPALLKAWSVMFVVPKNKLALLLVHLELIQISAAVHVQTAAHHSRREADSHVHPTCKQQNNLVFLQVAFFAASDFLMVHLYPCIQRFFKVHGASEVVLRL